MGTTRALYMLPTAAEQRIPLIIEFLATDRPSVSSRALSYPLRENLQTPPRRKKQTRRALLIGWSCHVFAVAVCSIAASRVIAN